MRPSEVLTRATAYLERHGVDSPRTSAEALLSVVLGTDRAGLYARVEGLTTAQARVFGRALCQRCTGVPLQYLTGEQDFMGLRLTVGPGVFVPRRMSEPLDTAIDLPADAATEPDNALARQDAVRTAVSRFLELPAAQRSCVILKDVLDYSLDEIAALLELSEPAVKAALHRGRERLIEVALIDGRVTAIRDFRYVPYIARDAAMELAAAVE